MTNTWKMPEWMKEIISDLGYKFNAEELERDLIEFEHHDFWPIVRWMVKLRQGTLLFTYAERNQQQARIEELEALVATSLSPERTKEVIRRIIRWVSVKDKLPDKDGPVIVYVKSADPKRPFIMQAWYHPITGFSMIPEIIARSISHWQPMPEPPEE